MMTYNSMASYLMNPTSIHNTFSSLKTQVTQNFNNATHYSRSTTQTACEKIKQLKESKHSQTAFKVASLLALAALSYAYLSSQSHSTDLPPETPNPPPSPTINLYDRFLQGSNPIQTPAPVTPSQAPSNSTTPLLTINPYAKLVTLLGTTPPTHSKELKVLSKAAPSVNRLPSLIFYSFLALLIPLNAPKSLSSDFLSRNYYPILFSTLPWSIFLGSTL